MRENVWLGNMLEINDDKERLVEKRRIVLKRI
jgi:hypothetical protein